VDETTDSMSLECSIMRMCMLDRHRAISTSGKDKSHKEIRRGISNNRSSRMKS
jgi:hypothetical protein